MQLKTLFVYDDIRFSTARIDTEKLNWLHNMSDCTINIAGNEGFGLTTVRISNG